LLTPHYNRIPRWFSTFLLIYAQNSGIKLISNKKDIMIIAEGRDGSCDKVTFDHSGAFECVRVETLDGKVMKPKTIDGKTFKQWYVIYAWNKEALASSGTLFGEDWTKKVKRLIKRQEARLKLFQLRN